MGEASWDLLLSEQIRLNSRLFFRLSRNIVRDSAAAEDICQRAFLQAWQQRDQIDGVSLRGWLAKTVINGSLQHVRRRKVEQRANAEHAQGQMLRSQLRSDQSRLRQDVLAAVDRLPEPSRTVVAMRLLDGLRGGDVATLLDLSASEVSRQLHRGLEHLRHLLAETHSQR